MTNQDLTYHNSPYQALFPGGFAHAFPLLEVPQPAESFLQQAKTGEIPPARLLLTAST
jgi:hypothetical protein